MRRLLVMFVCFFVLFGTVVDASISVKGDFENSYNLGDKISGSVELNSVVEGDFLLKDYFDCGGQEFVFYTTPLSLSLEEFVEISIPSFPVHKRLIGKCSVVASLESVEGDLIEEGRGSVFEVDSSLKGVISSDQTEVNQNGEISFSVNLDENRDYSLFSEFSKDDRSEINNLNFSGLVYSGNASIPSNLSRGEGIFKLRVVDNYGNTLGKNYNIEVMPVVASASLSIFNVSVKPSDGLNIEVRLYDFFRAKIFENVSVKIINDAKNVIQNLNVLPYSREVIELDKSSRPGKYEVVVGEGLLEVSETFEVIELRDVDVDVDDGFLVLTNLGNVNFGGLRSINASNSKGQTYSIQMDINLAPGERQKFNLGESLPEGKYEIVFGAGEVYHFLKNVIVEDKRSVSKKVSQGMSGLTGNAIIDTDSEKGFFGLVLFILVGTGLVFLFSKNKLKGEFIGKIEGLMHRHGKEIGDLKGSLTQEKRSNRELKGLFDKYAGKDVLEAIKNKKHGMEKRDIAVLFTDLRGFSKMFDSKDTIEITKMLDMHFKKISEIVKGRGGFVNKFIGDSVMVLFNAPKENNDFVLKAVRSGLKIREEMSKINERLKNKGLDEISVDMGIDFGKAAVGILGSQEKSEYTAIGVPVNVAFRLQGIGKGDQIVISERVYALLRDEIEVEELGEVELKNINRPLKIYNVLRFKE